MASVQIENLRKSYGLSEVIHNVSFAIPDGEFVILVGPSGCGKSTLLRMIAGLETITGGEISIDGRVVNDLEPKDRDIAMVFQNYALYPQMTVAQNMGFALELAKRPRAEITEKVNAAAEVLGLQDLLRRKPAQLSGGQRQRVAMGRAIVRDPKVFLFDEPLSNLDAKLRVHMRGEIKSLHRRLGTTIVYVTHDQIEAMTMADRIVVLNAGAVEQVGAPLELYDQPANVFVAGFLGSPAMNLMSGRITGGENSMLELDSGKKIQTRSIDKGLTGRKVTFGIRPEHLRLAETGGVELEVESLEPTGSETHLATRLGAEEIVCVLKERVNATEGASIRLSFLSDQSHFFDAETGQRINA